MDTKTTVIIVVSLVVGWQVYLGVAIWLLTRAHKKHVKIHHTQPVAHAASEVY